MNPGKENKSNSLLGDAWRVLKKNKAAATSAWVMVVMGLMVIIGPLVSPFALDQTDWYQISARPDLASGHIFGTDNLGRDLFVRVMHGGRVSLMVVLVATMVSVILGVFYGFLSGFIGVKTDVFMMRVVVVFYSTPFWSFVIFLVFFFGTW